MYMTGKSPVEAKLVGSTLVAAFHQSTPSLIWKFDLERNHSFTLALQGEEGDLELGVTSSKGEFYPIARFTTREDADQAFEAVQKVLMTRRYNWLKIAGAGLGGFLGLLFLLWIAGNIAAHFSSRASSQASSTVAAEPMAPAFFSGPVGSPVTAPQPAPTPPPAPPPKIQDGVPMSADQVLRPPP